MNTDKIHEHELCGSYSSANDTNGDQISEGPVASMWEVRSAHDTVVMNLQADILGSTGAKYEDNYSDCKETTCQNMGWTPVAQDTVCWHVLMNASLVPQFY
jgi:hypothetical protein